MTQTSLHPRQDCESLQRCFDLDEPVEIWHPRLQELVWAESAWAAISKSLADHDDEVIWQLMNETEDITLDLAYHLVDAAKTVLREEYDFVAACHGCRPVSIESYRRDGLQPTNPEQLLSEARRMFFDVPDCDAIIRCCFDQSALARRRDRVGLLLSRRMARQKPTPYALGGSEFLRIVANRLGDDAKQMWSTRGTPTLIQCRIPVAWLTPPDSVEPALDVYAGEAMRTLPASWLRHAIPFPAISLRRLQARSRPLHAVLRAENAC